MSYAFSPIALHQLHAAGWTEDRSIDLTEYERKVLEIGYELFPCVREFLWRFGNLEFRRSTGDLWLETNLWTPDAADIEGYNEVGEQFGTPLYYIGTKGDGDCNDSALLMAPNGHVYEYTAWGTWRIGVSGEDALEACLTRRLGFGLSKKPSTPEDAARVSAIWREYVERTGIVPPDEVIALLIPEAQEAIREAAGNL